MDPEVAGVAFGQLGVLLPQVSTGSRATTAAMDMTLKAQRTARRNLAQRIARLLETIDKSGREPTAWEQHYLSLALDDLDNLRSRQGEETMLWAESPSTFDNPVNPRPLPANARTATAAELRHCLQAAIEEKD